MNLIEYYNQNIIEGFDKYHIPDLNIETAKVVFFLESGNIEEVKHKTPLCGKSGRNFSEKLFDHKIPFGLWDEKPKTIGILESSPFPLQKAPYFYKDYPINKSNIRKIDGFEELRENVYNINPTEWRELINHIKLLPEEIVETKLYTDYTNRVDRLLSSENVKVIVLCGIFGQRFFNSYLSQNKFTVSEIKSYGSKPNTGIIKERNIRLIYINHPEVWEEDSEYSKYMKSTVQEIQKLIKQF